MTQERRWEDEYTTLQNLPSSRPRSAARAVVEFVESHSELSGRAIDVGCGLGRNTIYLAQKGFTVLAFDISKTAVSGALKATRAAGVENRAEVRVANAGEPLPVENDSASVVVDMMTLHLLDTKERSIYCGEIIRAIRPGGWFVVKTLAADSEDAQHLISSSPGKEPDSYVIPETGMVEKCFTSEELQEMFAPLEVVRMDKITEPVDAFGGTYNRSYYVANMQKLGEP